MKEGELTEPYRFRNKLYIKFKLETTHRKGQKGPPLPKRRRINKGLMKHTLFGE